MDTGKYTPNFSTSFSAVPSATGGMTVASYPGLMRVNPLQEAARYFVNVLPSAYLDSSDTSIQCLWRPSMSHLWDRLAEAKSRLAPVQSKYRVLFEDPTQPDAPAAVLVPDPNWMAAALEGNILPPIDTYLRDRDVPDGQPKEHPYAEPIGAMTEEEAIEYLIQKDIPPQVWRDYQGNRSVLKIVPVELIPSDRSFRNAWKINQEMEMAA